MLSYQATPSGAVREMAAFPTRRLCLEREEGPGGMTVAGASSKNTPLESSDSSEDGGVAFPSSPPPGGPPDAPPAPPPQ